jgi:sulfatase modifying factor 1
LQVNGEVKELIQKSLGKFICTRWAIRLRWLILTAVVGIALLIATLGVTGQLNRFMYKSLPIEWVDIPAGDFLMGDTGIDTNAHLDEFSQHRVYLDANQIGRYLITNQQYAQCVCAGICGKLSPLIDDPEKADYPEVNVTWDNAQAFFNWNRARLPTEAEWERAARGGLIGTLYRWGDEIIVI